MVHGLLRPALECLQREMVAQYSIGDLQRNLMLRDRDLELLLGAAQGDATGESPHDFAQLVQGCVEHLGCGVGALLIPDKNIAVCRTGQGVAPRTGAELLTRTHRNLLAWSQLHRRTMTVNRPAEDGPLGALSYKVLSCPVLHGAQRVLGLLVLFKPADSPDFDLRQVRIVELLARHVAFTGGCLGVGMLASLAHLGTKSNAWRVFANLRHSSLSKEVFFTLVFGLGLLSNMLAVFLHQDMTPALALASIAGLGLIDNMPQVYRLPAAPGWNSWRTNAGFVVSALLLGVSVMTPLLAYEAAFTGIQFQRSQQISIGLSLLALFLAQLALLHRQPKQTSLHKLRGGLILTGMAITTTAVLLSSLDGIAISLLILTIVMLEDTLGRWLFYRSRI